MQCQQRMRSTDAEILVSLTLDSSKGNAFCRPPSHHSVSRCLDILKESVPW
jgi:hypothetical protein